MKMLLLTIISLSILGCRSEDSAQASTSSVNAHQQVSDALASEKIPDHAQNDKKTVFIKESGRINYLEDNPCINNLVAGMVQCRVTGGQFIKFVDDSIMIIMQINSLGTHTTGGVGVPYQSRLINLMVPGKSNLEYVEVGRDMDWSNDMKGLNPTGRKTMWLYYERETDKLMLVLDSDSNNVFDYPNSDESIATLTVTME